MTEAENDLGFRFKNWDIYKDARQFRIGVNELLKKYPKEEQYALVDQTRRSLLSVILNIAEGSNKNSDKDTRVYINRAQTSLDEIVACLDCGLDSRYITQKDHQIHLNQIVSLAKRLQGFNNYLGQRSKIKDRRSAFTLIEAVVAASVFAFVVSSVLGVYMATLKVDTKTRAQRTVIQNGRFIMDFLAKEVRNGVINYSAYPGGVVNNTTNLYLINAAAEAEQFSLNGTDLILTKFGVGSTNLNSDQVKVTKLLFYISPDQDPLTSQKLANQQPNVTIVLELTSDYGSNPTDMVKINLQSTFAVRYYPSRLP